MEFSLARFSRQVMSHSADPAIIGEPLPGADFDRVSSAFLAAQNFTVVAA